MTLRIVQLTEGDAVVYVDPKGRAHMALVTANHGAKQWDKETGFYPSINIVYVDLSEGARDSYGQQLVRQSSVVHESVQQAHGNYWKLMDLPPML